MIIGKCKICNRDMLENVHVNQHHLIPKAKNGRHGPKITLHTICHNKIHSLWTEAELAGYYHTVERIVNDPEMQKFIKWVKKRPPDFYIKTKRRKRNGR